MKINRLHDAPHVAYDLDGHILGQFPAFDVVHLNLKPGEKIEKHINPKDVLFFVIEGKAMLETDTGRVLITKDQYIHVEGGINRGFENISIASFKVLVIKSK